MGDEYTEVIEAARELLTTLVGTGPRSHHTVLADLLDVVDELREQREELTEPCPECNGKGVVQMPEQPPEGCGMCGGSGRSPINGGKLLKAEAEAYVYYHQRYDDGYNAAIEAALQQQPYREEPCTEMDREWNDGAACFAEHIAALRKEAEG